MREECLFFLFGQGGNGKGTLIHALKAILGDYAKAAELDMFMVTPHEKHLAHLAHLQGARFVTASETEAGRRWALSKIKEYTGNEGAVTANFMRQNPFDFIPEFKFWFLGNAKPAIPKVDRAIRRRLNLVPFRAQPNRDETLKERLVAEYPGILRWAINGCQEWLEHGLDCPRAIADATKAYLDEEDILTRWIEDRCINGSTLQTPLAQLTYDFKLWADANSERTLSSKALARDLLACTEYADLGRTMKGRVIGGIALASDRECLVDNQKMR